MTRTERMNYHYMADAMRRFDWDMHQVILSERRVPAEWHEIALERGERRKVKVTLDIEEEVLKFFRSLGLGYGPRMALVLRAFMHARLAGVLKGAETMDYLRAPGGRASEGAGARSGARPDWGATQAEMEALAPGSAEVMAEGPGVPMAAETESRAERLERLRAKMERR